MTVKVVAESRDRAELIMKLAMLILCNTLGIEIHELLVIDGDFHFFGDFEILC